MTTSCRPGDFEAAISRSDARNQVIGDQDMLAKVCLTQIPAVVGPVDSERLWRRAIDEGISSWEVSTLAYRDPAAIHALAGDSRPGDERRSPGER